MARTPQDVTPGDPAADFGANDWLIEELREQYLADPDSVDSSWAAYFKAHTDGAAPAPRAS